MTNENTTTEPIRPGNFAGILPEWGRFDDVKRIFGIGRGTVYNLLKRGKIRGCTMRAKGNKIGMKLIYMDSVRAYLSSEMARAEAQSATLEAA